MVFNQATKKLLEKAGMVPTPSHDWWLYQLVTGASGVMYYDPTSFILYRQHAQSHMGSNMSMPAKFSRFCRLLGGHYKIWTDLNIQSLRQAESLLSASNLEILNLFEVMRKAKIKDRLRLLEVCGLYRQTWRGTISLLVTALIKKI
jgi:hypothetical protein